MQPSMRRMLCKAQPEAVSEGPSLAAGVDWVAVARYVDFRKEFRGIAGPAGLGREEEGPMLLDGYAPLCSIPQSVLEHDVGPGVCM